MTNQPDDQIKKIVEGWVTKAKETVESVPMSEFQSGEWLPKLLTRMITAHENATADYFREKYPKLSDEQIADKLIQLAEQYSIVIGTVSGMGLSLNQVASLGTAGLMIPSIGVGLAIEMFLLTKIQVQLIYELSILYECPLNPEDPEDFLIILGYAVGAKPINLVGNFAKQSASHITQRTIKKYISKNTLRSIQSFGRAIGVKILQRTIIKYAIPVVSIALGSGFNYITTRSVGRIARSQFKNQQTQESMPQIDTDTPIYAAALYLSAHIDGTYTEREQAIYEIAIVTDYSEDEYFLHLIDSQDNLLEALENVEQPQNLMDLLKLMAICEGDLTDQQTLFLLKVANKLGLSVDIIQLATEAKTYQVSPKSPNPIDTLRNTAGNILEPIGQHIGYLGNTLQKIAKVVKDVPKTSASSEE